MRKRSLQALQALTKLNIKKKKPKKNIFEQFGVKFVDTTGNQAIGNCPFCGTNDHFFVNLESKNKTWDCKKCSRSGGFRGFIEQIIEYCFDESNDKIMEILSEQRNHAITYDTLMRHIGYHPWTQNYIIPYADRNNSVTSLKIYDMNKMYNGSGFEMELYGMWEYENIKKSDKIFICEGEWDYLTLVDILDSLRINIPILALPGAGSFKIDYISLFENKDVYILLDNDAAGQAGTLKICKYLWNTAKTIYEIRWTKDKKRGFDIRDLLAVDNLSCKKAYEYIQENLIESEKPDEVITKTINDDEDETYDEEKEQRYLIERFYPLKPINHEEIFNVYKNHLYLPDDSVLYITFGAMVAGRISGNPLWLFIVGPSGCGKSEILMSLSGAPSVEAVSTLTPRALVSGWNSSTTGSGDSSLLPKLHNRMLVIKDFTTILSMNRIDQEEIISIFRDAYDGEFIKQFGNGITRRYKAKFGIIAASTADIEMFSEKHSVLGERFIRWRMHIPDGLKHRLPYLEKATQNAGLERAIRIELRQAANKILEADYSNHIPSVSKELSEKLYSLAMITAKLRTMVYRDFYTKDIYNHSETELATRLNKQFLKLMLGIGAVRMVKECGDFEYNLIKQVAKSSIQYRVYKIFKAMYRNKRNGISIKAIDQRSTLSSGIVDLLVENLVTLRLVQPVRNGSRYSQNYTYKINQHLMTDINKCEILN